MASSSAQTSSPAQDRAHPQDIIAHPKSGRHLHTFIVLHGRGSNGPDFSNQLLNAPIPGFGTLSEAFPDARFIFPTAAKRRAESFNRSMVNQWFDNWSPLTATPQREELQFDGLKKSSEWLSGMLKSEIEKVGGENVVLWGMSQGCALSLITLLLYRGEKFAAMIGMCGWLPLQQRMLDLIRESDPDSEDDIPGISFAGERDKRTSINKVVDYLHEELQLPRVPFDSPTPNLRVPVFLGHGMEDEKVPVSLDRKASALLRELDRDVEYKEYAGLAHWYSGEMLRDIVHFVQNKAGWSAVAAPDEA